MSWKPTEGLRLAESVVQTILNDNIACGVPPMTNPTARWKMVETIAKALDGFRAGSEEPEFPLEVRDDGHDYSLEAVIGRVQAMAQPRDYVMGAPTNGEVELPDPLTDLAAALDEKNRRIAAGDWHPADESVPTEPIKTAKRRRGRPKGSKAKKAKAVKAPEAEAAP